LVKLQHFSAGSVELLSLKTHIMRFFSVIFFFFLSHLTYAQFNSRLNLETSYGFIIPHSNSLKPFAENRPYGISLHYQMMGLSEKKWSACNCFHYLGIQLSHYNFADREVLGTASSLSGTFEPIIWKNSSWTFSVLSGMGFTYLNRVFDEDNNPDNVFFSSNLSFLLFLTPRLEYMIQENFGVNLLFSYNHISNGGQKQPNKGINFPMVGIGMSYYLNKSKLPVYSAGRISNELFFFIEGGFTTRKTLGQEGRSPSLSLVFGAVKPVSAINGIGAGLELNKDYSLTVENTRLEALMPSPYIAHHFLFGRFDFSQRMAVYTQKPFGYVDHLFFQRYLLKYKIHQNLSLGISLKAHGHVAENLDFRMSWEF